MEELTASLDHLHMRGLTKQQRRSYRQLISAICPKYLTEYDAKEILDQFNRHWIEDGQVLWSGVCYKLAQDWARQRGKQTLTNAMGPLMDFSCQQCYKFTMSAVKWTKYIKGASAIFSWKIAQGNTTILLTPPPPGRFHPSGLTNYQDIEEPILKGIVDGKSVGKIVMVHPGVDGAEDFSYEYWPKDKKQEWTASYGYKNYAKPVWRTISHKRRNQASVLAHI